MATSDPLALSRTKYVLIFLGDGTPSPSCPGGCDYDPDRALAWCYMVREQWCNYYGVPSGSVACDLIAERYPGLHEPCLAYNTEPQILSKVTEIVKLGQRYGVGELALHTALLFSDALPQVIADIFAADATQSEALLQAMAKAGNGFYRNFSSGQAIDFLDINYSSVERPFGMTTFFAHNPHAHPSPRGLLVDSDGDGVDDETEYAMGMDPTSPDSDGDGYGDKLELDMMHLGFDPLRADLPIRLCPESERIDPDGDGLNNCEERVLGTDPKVADTDRDGVPDGIEFFWGTDPLRQDMDDDPDFDGVRSGQEIRNHTHPLVADANVHAEFRYLYDMQQLAERLDRRTCYRFTVRNISLTSTLATQDIAKPGYNHVLVYFAEGPLDDGRDYGTFRAACVRARFIEGVQNFKQPADGLIHLSNEHFMPLPELLYLREMARFDPALDPCVGVPRP